MRYWAFHVFCIFTANWITGMDTSLTRQILGRSRRLRKLVIPGTLWTSSSISSSVISRKLETLGPLAGCVNCIDLWAMLLYIVLASCLYPSILISQVEIPFFWGRTFNDWLWGDHLVFVGWSILLRFPCAFFALGVWFTGKDHVSVQLCFPMQ